MPTTCTTCGKTDSDLAAFCRDAEGNWHHIDCLNQRALDSLAAFRQAAQRAGLKA